MALTLQIQLRPDANAILRQAQARPGQMLRAIARAMDQQNLATISHIQHSKLSQRGPLTLGVISGLLRHSVHAEPSIVIADGVQCSLGTMGSNVKYAGVHEFGGTFQIPGHTRRIHFAGGRQVKEARFLKALGRKTKKSAAERGLRRVTSYVRPHRATFQARAFMRAGIEENRGEYVSAISEAVVREWNRPSST